MASLNLYLKSLQDPDPWIIEQKVFDVLNHYLQPDSIVSPESAAVAIDNLTPMKRRAVQEAGEDVEEPESFLLELSCIFIEIAKQIPHNHPSQERYIQFFKDLSSLPPTTVTANDGYNICFWTGLPTLDTTLEEAWLEPKEEDDTFEPFHQWINLNCFAARLLASGLVYWVHFAIWSLRDALECRPPKSRDFCEFRIIAAAQWIEYSSSKLLRRLDEDGDEDDDEALKRVTAAGPLYEGKPGLCPERWLFWKERFRSIAREVDSEEIKSCATDAANAMDLEEQKANQQTSEHTKQLGHSDAGPQ